MALKCKACSTNNVMSEVNCTICGNALKREGEGGDYVEVPCNAEGVDLEDIKFRPVGGGKNAAYVPAEAAV